MSKTTQHNQLSFNFHRHYHHNHQRGEELHDQKHYCYSLMGEATWNINMFAIDCFAFAARPIRIFLNSFFV